MEITDQHGSAVFEDWARQVSEVSEFLGSIIKDKEQDFLDLGQNLHEISSKSAGLSNMADELMKLTSGEKILNAQQDLQDELKDITEYCDVGWGEKSTELLGNVLDQSRALSLEMNDFKKIVRTLNVLSFTTRIESARLGDIGRGFMTLADDVEALGRKMVGHWQRIVDESSTLYDLVQSAKIRVEMLVQDQKSGVEKVLEDINSNLNDLETIRQSSKAASEDLAQKASEITSYVREMVSSMQFHDITRQIVEHVQETLEEVVNLIKNNGNGSETKSYTSTQLAGWINKVCSLQIQQMDQAGISFYEAVENLKKGLDSIASSVSSMAEGLKQSLGLGDDEQGNLLVNIGEKIAHVKLSIHDFTGKSHEISTVMETVGGSVSQMSDFVNDIEEVGSEIELIALNASVRAAHTGSEGMALGVVAVAIQQLSGRAREKTGAVTATLNSISSDAEELQKLTAQAVDFSGFDDLSKKIDRSLNEMSELNAEIEQKLGLIISEGSNLSSTISFLSENLDFHHEVSTGISEAKSFLQQVVQQTESEFHSDFEDTQWPANLQRMFDRYTMESQRLVHKVQLEGETQDQDEIFWDDDEQGANEETQDGDDFGDNIELF